MSRIKILGLLFGVLILISCNNKNNQQQQQSSLAPNSQKIEHTTEPKALQDLKEMGFSFDGKKPILKEHLNQKSLITFIGKKLTPDSKYLQIITKIGIEKYAHLLFKNGITKNPDRTAKRTIIDHRETEGLTFSSGLISTSSELEVASTFTKDSNVKKQAGLIIVVHNDMETAVDINAIYNYYDRKPKYDFWDKEQEFARVKNIPGKDILGIYYIDNQGLVSSFISNTGSTIQWRDEPNLEKVQIIWNNAKRDISHYSDPSTTTNPQNIHSINSSLNIYWLIDWADYGGTADIDASIKRSEHLKWIDDSFTPRVADGVQKRYYGETINLSKPQYIFTGSKFYIYYQGTNIPELKISVNGHDCSYVKSNSILNELIVNCDSVNNKYLENINDLSENDRTYIMPADRFYSSKQHIDDDQRHPFDQNFGYHRAVPYKSFAFTYWKENGVPLDSLGYSEYLKTFSSECALATEKAMFALGDLHKFIKNNPNMNKMVENEFQKINEILREAQSTVDGNNCHTLGREVPCFEGCPNSNENINRSKGWKKLWDDFGEYSVIMSLKAKYSYFSELSENDSNYGYKKKRWEEAICSVNKGSIPVYSEPQIIWGNGNGNNKKAMNKVGRFWQFVAQPILIEKK